MFLPPLNVKPTSDRCESCGHVWHGLACERYVLGEPCPCRGPWHGDGEAWLPRKPGLGDAA